MRSNTQAMNNKVDSCSAGMPTMAGNVRAAKIGIEILRRLRRPACSLLPGVMLLAGCAHVPNQFAEDGPASRSTLESPTVQDAFASYQASKQRDRGWQPTVAAAESGAVTHWPLYTEDPFEDKGTDRPDGPNKYFIGWEDYVALPYGIARHTLNIIGMPVSMVVQPPWTLMESDGELSKQCLGYDHDATEKGESAPAATQPQQ